MLRPHRAAAFERLVLLQHMAGDRRAMRERCRLIPGGHPVPALQSPETLTAGRPDPAHEN